MNTPAAVSRTTRTTCAYCGVGCGVLARVERASRSDEAGDNGGRARVTIEGDPAHPAGAGRLCSKGSALGDTLTIEGRLLRPRIDGRETGWDEALETVASRFLRTIDEHGPDSVAFYASGQLLTEDYYVANKLMKGFLGTANIDTNSRLCMSSAVVAHQRAFGEDVVPGCYDDLELADVLVLVGSNAAWCHPVLWHRMEEARRRNPSMRVVVLDPRRTPTCEGADLHLPLRSGSDVVLFNGLLAWLDGQGLADVDYLAARTEGADEALAVARQSAGSIEDVARACDLPAADVETFYRLFASTERVVTAFSQGVNQSSSGSDKATSILNCHLLTGRIGRPGCGPFSLTGQPNAMGGRETGGMASMLAAHMDLDNDEHRRMVQQFWRSPRMASRPGLKAVDLFDAVGDGRIKALWIMATNPAVSMPDADRVRRAIANCDFVVVSDCTAATDTAALADVLLPAAAWGEKDGTTTNSERLIARQRAFVAPPGEARPDWWILSQVAARMGHGAAFRFESAHEIFVEHARLSTMGNLGSRVFDLGGFSGLSPADYDALEPIRWPVPRPQHPGTPRVFAYGGFSHPGGKARLVATSPRPPANRPCAEYPFLLNSGRIRDQWHTMTRTGLSARLGEHFPEPFVHLHPQDADNAGIESGDLVRVSSRWGSATLRARTGREVAAGTLFVPIHWSAANSSHGRIGAVVNPVVDPHSGEPEFKHTPVAIEKVTTTWHGVLVTRRPCEKPPASWWVRVQGDGCARLEMAGGVDETADANWADLGPRMLAVQPGAGELLEYIDAGAGTYRAAVVRADRLEACLFVAVRSEALPARQWLGGLFARESLDQTTRTALLAGRPLEGNVDTSALVCSCFGVRRRTIAEAALREGLETPAQVGACLRAGTNCGSCLPELRDLLASLPSRSAAA